MVPTEAVATFVRKKSPFAFCPACIAARLQADEKDVREAAQQLVLLPGFAVSVRICSSCGRMEKAMELRTD
jgi:hypothetical protein